VYAAARNVESLPNFGDSRVIPVQLDITDPNQVATASQLASDVDILLNNAGSLAFAGVAGGEFRNIEADMKVNYFGTIRMVQAFAPVLESRGGGAIANFSSIAGLAGMAAAAGYSASKAAVLRGLGVDRYPFQPTGERYRTPDYGPINPAYR
jgi:NADP-dependent 3-hydroxy acid dehydrogenase YdfG